MSLAFTVAFWVLAAVALTGAFGAVVARRLFHSALFLGVSLIGVAGLFFALGQEVLGAVQILVYVGGILTLLLFAIMFVTRGGEPAHEA